MKKILITLSLLNVAIGIACGQVYNGQFDFSKIPSPLHHYQEEYTFDTAINVPAWAMQRKGMHVSFASTDQSYFRTEVPQLERETTSFEGIAWKGERLNTEVLVWSPDTLKQVRFIVSDLKSKNGRLIDKKKFRVNMIRYVASNYPYGVKDATCGASPYKGLYLMPDRFEAFDRFDVPGKTVRPVWLSLDIPAETEAGEYSGTMEVRSENYTSTLNLKVTVQRQRLPRPHDWKHRLDLWQNPWVVAWENDLKPWSEEHKLLLRKHLQLYADAGGKYITTYGVHSPWSGDSYMIEGTMIEWIKQKNGNWKFDYSIFDEYVQLAMSVGIDKAITFYTPFPRPLMFRYKDEKTGNYLYESWPADSRQYKTFWNMFLTDFKKHLEQKGWFEKTYIGINENVMEETMSVIRLVKGHSKNWKITYAGDWHQELASLLDDYCFLYGKESDVNVVKHRAAQGFTTTYYVCCNPPYPNNFVFSPPIEGRWMGWYSVAHAYDGFLRWAYDAWPADPKRDARHDYWPAGDCFVIYPGANSCIRFEKLREGIVDYEKIRILRQKASTSHDKVVHNLIQQLDEHLKTFLNEKDFDTRKITSDVDKGKKIVEQLSEQLAK